MLTAILVNGSARLIFSTNTPSAKEKVEDRILSILAKFKAGTSEYQKKHNSNTKVELVTEIKVLNANESNKRKQVVKAFDEVETDVLVMVDDTAIWQPRFLEASLPAFQLPKVGFVGTRKWVKRESCERNKTLSMVAGLWKQYRAGFWNTMGALYLVRHNFEIRATNAADGGVFCVPGRSSPIRTNLVKSKASKEPFLNEYVLGFVPLKSDDDNFITRFIINNGYDVKVESSKDATMTTTLGTYPLKFPEQCMRWSRTTFQ